MSRTLAAATSIALATAWLAVPGAATPQPDPAPTGPAITGSRLVTLLSGDVIRLDDLTDGTRRGVLTQDVGPRGVAVNSIDDRVYAVPHEAMPLVVGGRLDLSLFDVSLLAESGYGDDASTTIPLVTTRTAARRTGAQRLPAGARTTRTFATLGAVAATVAKADATAFWQRLIGEPTTRTTPATLPAGIERIWLDRKVTPALDDSVPHIGAPTAWADGYDGTGTTVAVLDTGIDTTHPDLAGVVLKSENFSYSPDSGDHHGHGTHVASTIAGSGAASGGSRQGVAPGARILNGKVLADWGSGSTSGVMAGMEWAVAEGADVVSMSLGVCCGDGTDVLSRLVDELSASSDTLFVIAAGNDGPGRGTVGMPGTAARALTVGATDRADVVAPFSSRGPDRGFHLKPDLAAPGVGIVAARASDGYIGTPVDAHYTALSGTSMATPHVAGAAAILRQRHPDRTAAQVKDALVSTAARGDDDVFSQGGGRVDVARVVRQALYASGSADFGGYEAPFAPGQVATRTITYTNPSTAPVILDLTVEATRMDDPAKAPVSAATVSPARMTVPAGGITEATVTVDLSAGELATYGGWVVAEGNDGEVVHTNIGWTRRAEHARLGVTVTDRHGGPVPGGVAWLIDLASGVGYAGTIANGQVSYYSLGVRPDLPVGHYMFLASYLVPGEDGRPVDPIEAVLPDVVLTEDSDVVVDAAQATQVRFDTPRPTQELGTYRITAERTFNGHTYRAGSPLDGAYLDTNQAPYLTPTGPVTEGGFAVTMYGRLIGPPLTAAPLRGPHRTLQPSYLWCIGNEACFPQVDGRADLRLVDAGTGEDLAPDRIRGSMVLVNGGPTADPEDIATRAAAAGAAGVVFWEDEGLPMSAVRGLIVDIPLMRVTASEGAWLASRAGERFRFAGEHPVPYTYDVAVTETGRVPDALRYRPDLSRNATLRRELRSPVPAPRCGHWDDLPAWLSGACRPAPHAFTHSVLPGLRYVTLTDSSWGANEYAPGEQADAIFNAGPLAPGAVESGLFPVPASTRANGPDADRITFTPGEPQREPDRSRHNRIYSPLIQERAEVFRDGTRIAGGEAREVAVEAPADSASYRFVYDATNVIPGVNRTSRSHTEWTFRSGHGDQGTATLPQLQVGYDVPLDLYNRAAAGRPLPVGIGITQPAGADPARITAVSLAVSFDGGGSWTDVPLHRRGDAWRGTVRHPALQQTDGYVAMRVRGRDAAGNTVDQTLQQAYALR